VQGRVGSGANTGYTGPQGPQGYQGPTGTLSASGYRGPQGGRGAQGTAANTGSPGYKGRTGTTGPNGPQGSQGGTGPRGSQGPASGTQGPTGSNFNGRPNLRNTDFYIVNGSSGINLSSWGLVPLTFYSQTFSGASTISNNNGVQIPTGTYLIELSVQIEAGMDLTGGSNTGSNQEFLAMGLYTGNPSTQNALIESSNMMTQQVSTGLGVCGNTTSQIVTVTSTTTYYLYCNAIGFPASTSNLGLTSLAITAI
jgi:hypothetical protein